MAVGAVCREVAIEVIGVFGSLIVLFVTVETIDSQGFENKVRGRLVAIAAFGNAVCACEREPAYLVYPGDVTHQPRLRSMAPGAIRTNGLLVDVGVARNAVGLRFLKHKAGVAGLAVDHLVLPDKGEACLLVIEAIAALL